LSVEGSFLKKQIILMFHGLGGDKNSMAPVGDYCASRLRASQLISVEGPMNLGTDSDLMLGWFVPPGDEERSLDGPCRPKLEGIAASVALVHKEIRNLVDKGAESKSIHLLGHSQGGAIAITAGLTYPERLGSVSSIAGYLALVPELSVLATGTQYFLHHSEHDSNVSVRWAHYAQKFIRKNREPCELKCWDIDRDPHSIHTDQLDSICAAIADAPN
jgi:phospholipase/carboxylesterase